VGPRTGLDDDERREILLLLGLELRPFGRPSCSQPLYGLSRLPSDLMQTRNRMEYSRGRRRLKGVKVTTRRSNVDDLYHRCTTSEPRAPPPPPVFFLWPAKTYGTRNINKGNKMNSFIVAEFRYQHYTKQNSLSTSPFRRS
jgi:hypothetical protein